MDHETAIKMLTRIKKEKDVAVWRTPWDQKKRHKNEIEALDFAITLLESSRPRSINDGASSFDIQRRDK